MQPKSYQIEGMDCPDCALKLEQGIRRLKGVQAAQVDYTLGRLQIEGQVDADAIRKRVEALGYRLEPTSGSSQPSVEKWKFAAFARYLASRWETRLALVGGALIAVSYLGLLLAIHPQIFLGLQITSLLLAGYPVARSAVANLVINRDANINLLMTLAAIGAIVIGEIAEAAMLIFLFALAEALEGFSVHRTRKVLTELSELAPARAILLTHGQENTVPVETLVPGDLILIRAGERIPMDGVVMEGVSEVNQAPITGESIPVGKESGSEVFAGTVNGSGTLTVRVTRPADDTTLSRIIHMVAQAQNLRAPSQRLIDRFARFYTPATILLALLVATLPPLFLNQPFFNPATGENGWLYRGLALLVIACPCALVISAPVTILSSIAAAARRGVLIKGGVFLEALSRIKVFAFDKTGTLTEGKPKLTLLRALDCSGEETCPACNQVLGLAYALEQRSAHPLAQAVVEAAELHGLTADYAPAERVTALAGMGLQGEVNGRLATIGSHALFEREHPHPQRLCEWVEKAENDGQTTMMICDGERVRGLIAVADQVRTHNDQVIDELHIIGIRSALLTGDNPTVAAAVAKQVGIDRVYASLLPDQKVEVAMVGDGINDTPALAAAALGVSLGGAASAQALETADVVLMADDLRQLPFAVRLSAFARRLLVANIAFSLSIKLIFAVLALAGVTSIWMAVLADMGVSLLVTFNGMRSLRFRG